MSTRRPISPRGRGAAEQAGAPRGSARPSGGAAPIRGETPSTRRETPRLRREAPSVPRTPGHTTGPTIGRTAHATGTGPRRRDAQGRAPGGRRGTSTLVGSARPAISHRAIGFVIVLVVALALLVPTVRHAIAQQEDLRAVSAQVDEARTHTEELTRQQRLWADEEYVRAQARDRLGYVSPGERAFVVVDPETVTGRAPQDAADVAAAAARERAATTPWYLNLWESVEFAGQAPAEAPAAPGEMPAPAPSEIAPPPSVTEEPAE